jgi:peptidoglycan-N-acetylglucosamine deacetylase
MKIFNFRNATLLFFLLLLIFNLTRIFICPCNDGISGFLTQNPLWFYLPLVALYLTIPVILAFLPCSQFHHYPVICHGSRNERLVSITFDDGPDPAITPVILDILKQHRISATFFIIGRKIEGNEELVRRIDREGHTIGNHSFAHSNLWDFWSPDKLRKDLLKTEDIIKQVTGKKVRFFRPPYGVINPMVESALRTIRYTVVAWSRRSLDTATGSQERLISRATDRLQPGEIILLHDTQKVTAGALKQIIASILRQELRIVSLEKLINQAAYE